MSKISQERRANIWKSIMGFIDEPLTDKDEEILEQVFSMESFCKAMGKVYARAQATPMQIMGVNLASSEGQCSGSQMQGQVYGLLGAVDILLDLITLPEEIDDE